MAVESGRVGWQAGRGSGEVRVTGRARIGLPAHHGRADESSWSREGRESEVAPDWSMKRARHAVLPSLAPSLSGLRPLLASTSAAGLMSPVLGSHIRPYRVIAAKHRSARARHRNNVPVAGQRGAD